MENLCAIVLYKHYNSDDDSLRLYYYNRNIEVDFYIPDEHIAIQASYDITDETTRKREVNALVQLHALEPLQQALIITYDQEEVIEKDGLIINVMPAWKWVLCENYRG